MRSTRARRAVTEIFETTAAPMSLHDIHQRVREQLPATAYSTVFRLVQRLERAGQVNRVDWRERGSRFEWADRAHHHHIVCSDCGHTVELGDADLGYSERRIESHTGFRIRHHAIELEGTCGDCQSDELA